MKPHILIIDDDTSILEMMRLVLESEGRYQVTTMENAPENITEIEHLQPHLILLDFLMYGREVGWTFLQKLKLSHSIKDIPVVMCTAALCDVNEQAGDFRQKGISILYKPFDVDELLRIVEQTLTSSPPDFVE